MENATPTAEQDTQPAAPSAAPKPGRERKAPSPEQAKKAAAAKRLKRKVEQLLESGDPDALERAAAMLAGEAGPPPKADGTAAPGAELAVPEKKPEPAAARPPTAEELEMWRGMANGLFAMVAAPFAGTKMDPNAPRPNPLGGEPLVPAKAIVEPLALVLAKHLPSAVATPEGQLALGLALWLGPPAAEWAVQKAFGKGEGPEQVQGAGVKAAA